MARAADGTMTLSGTFAVENTIPVSSTINGYISDILTEITDSWSRSGKGAALAHLSMGSFKLTTMADGVALTDAATVKQVQNHTVSWVDGGGTADAITATYSPVITAVVDGMILRTRATAANATTTPTFSPNGLTARTIVKLHDQALVAGDISGDGHELLLQYQASNTTWKLLNPATVSGVAVSATSLALSGDITPAEITADQNDYAPTGHGTASVFRLSSDASRNITGLAGGADGRIVQIYNVGAQSITLQHDSASSTAGNRFYIVGGLSLTLYGSSFVGVTLQYDATLSRWVMISSAGFTHSVSGAEMEAATRDWTMVTPVLQHRHPGHPKFWAYVTVAAGTPTLQTSYNVTSIADTATGRLTVTIATDFSSANWACIFSVSMPDTTPDGLADQVNHGVESQAAGTCVLHCWDGNSSPPNDIDPAAWHVVGLGDQ